MSMANKASKASDSRIERYYNNAMTLKSARTKVSIVRAACVAVVFIVWIVQMTLLYRNEALTQEPVFWAIIVGLTVLSLIGVLIAHNKYKKINEDYLEAVKRYEMLIGNKSDQ